MYRSESLPLLPGLTINQKIGWEKWHKSSQFDWLNGRVPYLVEPKRPSTAAGHPFPWDPPLRTYPSLYPSKDHGELPSWIIYDKKILSFDAYFQNDYTEQSPFQIRKVKINFFLEDGTVQVNERKIPNSGISLGTLISRRRIPFARPMEKAFYELIDFNIGKTVEMFGRVYYIFNCDKFTRQWLNRSGIPVPDPMPAPDQACDIKATQITPKPFPKKQDKLGQFLRFNGHVLRFFGYWDDRESEGGYLHKLVLQYYLSDDTIDVKEEGAESDGLLVARGRLPKSTALPEPGASDHTALLNVLATGYLKGRSVKDAKRVGAVDVEYYTDADLMPGVCVNVYGRAVILTDCDKFTEEFYRAKYGVDYFPPSTTLPPPPGQPEREKRGGELPPWNGFGSFEDSAANCVSLVPKAPHGKLAKKLVKARSGLDSNILRFRARMVSDDPTDQNRRFVIAFYLSDDTTSVFETADRNSGFEQRMFIGRKEAFKPVESLLVSRKPWTYTKEDFWVGSTLTIDRYTFQLLEADEYCLKYMELNSQEFPKSNIELILMKIRDKLRPVYKNFVRDYLLVDGQTSISPECLQKALRQLLGDDITPHEILTVARHFAVPQPPKTFTKETLQDICRNECRRLLFVGYERLRENLKAKDPEGTGFIPRRLAYSMCRGAKLPVLPTLLDTVLDIVNTNEAGEVNIEDLLSFFDTQQNEAITFVPFNHAREFSELGKLRSSLSTRPARVDCLALIEKLNLEEELKKEG